jgi:hypothetical protein
MLSDPNGIRTRVTAVKGRSMYVLVGVMKARGVLGAVTKLPERCPSKRIEDAESPVDKQPLLKILRQEYITLRGESG